MHRMACQRSTAKQLSDENGILLITGPLGADIGESEF